MNWADRLLASDGWLFLIYASQPTKRTSGGCGKLDCSRLHSCTLRTSNCPLCLGYPGLVMKVFRQNSDYFSWALWHYHSSPQSTRIKRFEMLLPVESVWWKWQNQTPSCLIFWRHIFSSEEERLPVFILFSIFSLSIWVLPSCSAIERHIQILPWSYPAINTSEYLHLHLVIRAR